MNLRVSTTAVSAQACLADGSGEPPTVSDPARVAKIIGAAIDPSASVGIVSLRFGEMLFGEARPQKGKGVFGNQMTAVFRVPPTQAADGYDVDIKVFYTKMCFLATGVRFLGHVRQVLRAVLGAFEEAAGLAPCVIASTRVVMYNTPASVPPVCRENLHRCVRDMGMRSSWSAQSSYSGVKIMYHLNDRGDGRCVCTTSECRNDGVCRKVTVGVFQRSRRSNVSSVVLTSSHIDAIWEAYAWLRSVVDDPSNDVLEETVTGDDPFARLLSSVAVVV